ncbi:MAG: hypothetical protein WDM86_16700 [Rhizomicrobium sp.]
MAQTFLYRAYGLIVRSELPIPGACLFSGKAEMCPHAPDIEIVVDSVCAAMPGTQYGPYRRNGNSLLYEMPGIARYLCQAGRRMVVEPACGASATDVGDMLIATALPALLWMRPGEIVLHAAGAAIGAAKSAIAICGPSGSGKSTVLRSLLSAGRVLGDDTLRLLVAAEGVKASGLPARYCWSEDPGFHRNGHDVVAEQTLRSAPLAALCVLDLPRSTGPAEFRRLTGVEALTVLLAQRHRPKVPRLMGKEGEVLPLFGHLAKLPLYSWRRKEGAGDLTREELAFLGNRALRPAHKQKELVEQ